MKEMITISRQEYEELQSVVSILQELAGQISKLELEIFKLKQNKTKELSITTEKSKPKKICLQDLKSDDDEDNEDSELNAHINRAIDLLLKYGKEVM